MAHIIRNQQAAVWSGIAAIAFGTFLLYDAYDARGRRRPFVLKFVPGL